MNSQNSQTVLNKSKPTFGGVGNTFQEYENEIKMLQQTINEHPNPQTNSNKALVKNAYDRIAQIHDTLTKAANFNDLDKTENLKRELYNKNIDYSIVKAKQHIINKNYYNKHAKKLENQLERRGSINSTTKKQSLFNRFRNIFRKRSRFNNLRNNLTKRKNSNKLYKPLNKLKGNLNLDKMIHKVYSKSELKQMEFIKEQILIQKINNTVRIGNLKIIFMGHIHTVNSRKKSPLEPNYIESNSDKLARDLLEQLENLENDDDIQVRDNMSLEELEAQVKLMDERTKKIDEISRKYI
jgi:hypothetical protein